MVEVLSLGAKNPTRHPSDILPYLPSFRQYFAKLPTEMAEVELKILKIPLSDVEALTKTVAKVRGPFRHVNIRNGTDKIL